MFIFRLFYGGKVRGRFGKGSRHLTYFCYSSYLKNYIFTQFLIDSLQIKFS